MSWQTDGFWGWHIADTSGYGGTGGTPSGGVLTATAGYTVDTLAADIPTPKALTHFLGHGNKISDPGGAAGTVTSMFAISGVAGGGAGFTIRAVKVDATYYNVLLTYPDNSVVLGTGSTNFAWGTEYDFLLEADGTTARLWYGPSTTP